MPTVNDIAQQKSLTADVSSKIFRTDINAARNSILIKAPMESANNMVASNFGMRSNISEMLGTYTEEKNSFDSQFDKTMSSLKESADKLKESVQNQEEERAAVRKKAQESERDRRESAAKFADDAREKLDEARQERKERADQLAEITRERMQNSAQAQQDKMEELVEKAREQNRQATAVREQNQRTAQPQREQSAQTVAANEQNQQTTATREQNQQTIYAREQAQSQSSMTISDEYLRERIQKDEQSLRGRTEQLVYATRERAQTQRERTERFAQEYLVAERDDNEIERETVQNLNETRDENTNAALSNVRNFVDRFNDAVNYLNENRGMSDRMNALAGSFDRTENLAESLNDVGISVNENGRLTVNEKKLADAFNKNSANVTAVLGRDGFTGRLGRKIELATSQRENLFPSVTDYVNNRRDESTESLYAAQLNRTAALSRDTSPNFVNVFT